MVLSNVPATYNFRRENLVGLATDLLALSPEPCTDLVRVTRLGVVSSKRGVRHKVMSGGYK